MRHFTSELENMQSQNKGIQEKQTSDIHEDAGLP